MLGLIRSPTKERTWSRSLSSSAVNSASRPRRSVASGAARPAPGISCAAAFSPSRVLTGLSLADLLDNHGDALSHPDAHRGEAELHLGAATHLVQERGQDPCPGASERVAERDRAPVGVQPLVL